MHKIVIIGGVASFIIFLFIVKGVVLLRRHYVRKAQRRRSQASTNCAEGVLNTRCQPKAGAQLCDASSASAAAGEGKDGPVAVRIFYGGVHSVCLLLPASTTMAALAEVVFGNTVALSRVEVVFIFFGQFLRGRQSLDELLARSRRLAGGASRVVMLHAFARERAAPPPLAAPSVDLRTMARATIAASMAMTGLMLLWLLRAYENESAHSNFSGEARLMFLSLALLLGLIGLSSFIFEVVLV